MQLQRVCERDDITDPLVGHRYLDDSRRVADGGHRGSDGFGWHVDECGVDDHG